MPLQSHEFRLETNGGEELDVTPRVVVFTISQADAQRILLLSGLVVEHGLARVQAWDHRPRFMQFDPLTAEEDADEQGEDNDVRTECEALIVEEGSFYFTAYVKHTDARVSSNEVPLRELASQFGLELPAHLAS